MQMKMPCWTNYHRIIKDMTCMEREEKGCGRRGVLSEGGPDDGVNKGFACSPQEMIMYQKVRAYMRVESEGEGRASERGRDREIEMGKTQFCGPFRVFKCFKCSHLTMRPATASLRAFSRHTAFIALIALSKQSQDPSFSIFNFRYFYRFWPFK